MQTELSFFELEKQQEKKELDVGKMVRNINYQNIQSHISNEQQIVYACLLQYPEGLTDHEIAESTNLPLSSVNGRRNELMHHNLVKPVGIATYDDRGVHIRTMWGVMDV
jgi:predicted transcriptional regulator